MMSPCPSLCVQVDNGAPVTDPGSVLPTPQVVAHTTLHDLQAVSTQPNQVLFSDLSVEAQVAAPSHCTHQQECVLG